MPQFEVLIGTTLGNAEYVADELSHALIELGHELTQHDAPRFAELDLNKIWLVVSSTHGAGDLPENIQPLLDDLKSIQPDLTDLTIAICAIGDRSYDTFCQGPLKLGEALRTYGAKELSAPLTIDMQDPTLPEDQALNWLRSWQDAI